MSHYLAALEATEEHLRALQANGVRFLNVRAESMLALRRPLRKTAAQPETRRTAPTLQPQLTPTEPVVPPAP